MFAGHLSLQIITKNLDSHEKSGLIFVPNIELESSAGAGEENSKGFNKRRKR